jgi:hypothetical protein
MPVNYVPTKTGKVRAVCQLCDKRSAPVRPDEDGEPSMWSLAPGWSSAPYPHAFVHRDGSTGALWYCPSCNRRLKAGEALQVHESRGDAHVRNVG